MQSRIINLKKTSQRAISVYGIDIPNGIDILEEIIADENMVLTQSADVSIEDRVLGGKVMLGRGHSSSEWKEITTEEADEIERLKKEIEEEKLKQLDNKNV